MQTRYMLDTNTASYIIKGKPAAIIKSLGSILWSLNFSTIDKLPECHGRKTYFAEVYIEHPSDKLLKLFMISIAFVIYDGALHNHANTN